MIMTYGLQPVCDFEALMNELSILTADCMLPSNSKAFTLLEEENIGVIWMKALNQAIYQFIIFFL